MKLYFAQHFSLLSHLIKPLEYFLQNEEKDFVFPVHCKNKFNVEDCKFAVTVQTFFTCFFFKKKKNT